MISSELVKQSPGSTKCIDNFVYGRSPFASTTLRCVLAYSY